MTSSIQIFRYPKRLQATEVESTAPPNKPMHQTGAIVLKECIVFVRSRVSCDGPHHGRSMQSRLQVMGGAVMWRFPGPLAESAGLS